MTEWSTSTANVQICGAKPLDRVVPGCQRSRVAMTDPRESFSPGCDLAVGFASVSGNQPSLWHDSFTKGIPRGVCCCSNWHANLMSGARGEMSPCDEIRSQLTRRWRCIIHRVCIPMCRIMRFSDGRIFSGFFPRPSSEHTTGIHSGNQVTRLHRKVRSFSLAGQAPSAEEGEQNSRVGSLSTDEWAYSTVSTEGISWELVLYAIITVTGSRFEMGWGTYSSEMLYIPPRN